MVTAAVQTAVKLLGVLLPVTALLATSTAPAEAGPRGSTGSTVTVAEHVLPPGAEAPFGISAGPRHSVWFGAGDYVGRVSNRGRVSVSKVPTADANVGWLTQGPDHAVWFAERDGNKIGRVDARGRITETALPTPDSVPQALVFDRSGRLWYTASEVGKLGRLNADGTITEFPVPTGDALPLGMALGPDDALWFTERSAEKIGRFDLRRESFTEYPLPEGANPQRIVLGADGALWFTEARPSKVGRITTGGQVTEYAVPSQPVGIVADRKGLWYAGYNTARIGQLRYDGTLVAEYQVPTPDSRPIQITLRPGRGTDVWFTEQGANRIGHLSIDRAR
jgi:virginiamycin B lyase